jgi:predicted enzyme involved in methoxymalonyl-ACP biosynthesis
MVDINLALADPETVSSSESLSKEAKRALTFEFGVNWGGEVGEEGLAGVDPREEGIVNG